MRKKDARFVIASLLCAGAMSIGAAQVPVFEYSFPASYDGTGDTVTDLSVTGNNATLGDSDHPLSDDRPAGFDAALMSITGASNGVYGTTDEIDLLNTPDVEANGGFSMDVWVKWNGDSARQKLIEYAGTEALYTESGQITFGLSNRDTLLGHPIASNQWHHVVGLFYTQGRSAQEDLAYPGEYSIDGVAELYVDDVLVASKTNATKSSYGDRLNRGIGINKHPTASEYNQGMIFNPKVFLGAPEVPAAPPVWNDPIVVSDGVINEEYTSTLNGQATDANNDLVTYAKASGPIWLNVEPDGALSGIPSSDGTNSFEVVATAGGDSTTGTVHIAVRGTIPPVWDVDLPINGGIALASGDYGGSLAGKAHDPDGEEVIYTKTAGPTWLIVDADGTMSGTAPAAIGTNTFTVSADDGIDGATPAEMFVVVIESAPDPVAVFEYSFPASYNGTGTAITDLSGADNHAALYSSSDAPLIDDRPAGFGASLMSLSGSNGGHGRTLAIDLLNNTDIAANGGFTMDVWFKWDGSGATRKLIDYAGTESLHTRDGQIQFNLSNGGTLLGHDIVTNQWYHAVGIFDTLGNNAVIDPAFPNEYIVSGVAKLYVDDVLVASAADVVKSSFGDRLNRHIGLNMWPRGGDWNQGNIFNPSVYLGVYTGGGGGDPVAVEDLSISGPVVGGMVLSWTGESSWSYIVETNSNLVVGDWQPFTTVPGKDGANTVTNTIGPDQTFYRVISE